MNKEMVMHDDYGVGEEISREEIAAMLARESMSEEMTREDIDKMLSPIKAVVDAADDLLKLMRESEEMSREQAIRILRESDVIENQNDATTGEPTAQKLALDMAIAALSAEPCSDAISRQAAIEKIHWLGLDRDTAILCDLAIRSLPSVHAEPRTGHWIFCKGDGRTCVDGHICSVCKTSYHMQVPYFAEYKYCPNCGAKMEADHA